MATNNGAVNELVADEARAHQIRVNAADDVANCDFILPSVARRGKISIATSTGGSRPALARWLQEQMEEFLSEEIEALGDLLADVRILARQRDRKCAGSCELAQTPPPLLCKECPNRIHPDAWQAALDDELRALLRSGSYEAGPRSLAEQIADTRALAGTRICAVGDTTARALAGRGLIADLVPDEATGEAADAAIAALSELRNERVLLPRAENADPALPAGPG